MMLPDEAKIWCLVALAYQEELGEEVILDEDDIRKNWTMKLCENFKKPAGATGENDRSILHCIEIERCIQYRTNPGILGASSGENEHDPEDDYLDATISGQSSWVDSGALTEDRADAEIKANNQLPFVLNVPNLPSIELPEVSDAVPVAANIICSGSTTAPNSNPPGSTTTTNANPPGRTIAIYRNPPGRTNFSMRPHCICIGDSISLMHSFNKSFVSNSINTKHSSNKNRGFVLKTLD